MYFSSKAIGGTAAIYLLGQQVQCPPLAIPLIIDAAAQVAAAVGSAGASFAGAIISSQVGKRDGLDGAILDARDVQAPPGVPQYNFDLCRDDLAKESVHLTVNGPVSNHGIRIEGLPSTCMVLSTVIDGDAAGGPRPTPCGSACLLYDNLNNEDYEKMRNAFNAAKND
ncbi:hypothetical protein K4F52_000012 [Lecanicillium sp. MT-2017a]|nr:hypothetical protein K4F52_000012 [Lecanicillium sp. MT-2017a]